MRSFIRRYHHSRRTTRATPVNVTTIPAAAPSSSSSTHGSVSSSTANGTSTGTSSSGASTITNGIIGSSILTLLAIQAADVIITPINSNGLPYTMSTNTYHYQSSNGTLGPSTSSYIRMSCKGERNQSRSRLEVCTAITTSISASSKPTCYSLLFAKNLRSTYLISE